MASTDSLEGVRADWMMRVVDRCQIFANEAATVQGDQLHDRVDTLVDSVQDPQNIAEALALRGLLLELALRWATCVHRQSRRRARTAASVGAEVIVHHWRDRAASPQIVFGRWASQFLSAIGHAKQGSSGDKALAWLRVHYADPLRIATLARDVGCHPRRLGTLFKSQTGLSIRACQRRLRVEHAWELLRDPANKVECVAADVGFRSLKNFYRAVRAETGLTPSQLRDGWPAARQDDNVKSAREWRYALRRGPTPRAAS